MPIVDAPPLIAAEGLCVSYAASMVLHDVQLEVGRGQVVALLGANGAGKTTTVLTLAGELKPRSGHVLWNGQPDSSPLWRRARKGLAYVGEDRTVFMGLTLAENLRVAGADMDMAYDLFPDLRPLARRRTALLSGGEQQMLALARVLARRPSLLLADELSLGLAPMIVDRLLRALRTAADEHGMGVLVVEQHVEKALSWADYAYVLRRGKIVMQGTAANIRGRLDEVQDAYLTASPDTAPVVAAVDEEARDQQ